MKKDNGIKEARKIKGLQSQLKIMEGDVESLKIEFINKQREYNNKLNAIENIKEQIKKFKNNDNIKISEHAIIRYFERVKGFNMFEIEKEILTDDVLKTIRHLNINGIYSNGNFKILLKNKIVTTII